MVKDINKNKVKSKKTVFDRILEKIGLKKERRGRPKKKKGFTLIELLAVIVILGLLMAIAIPSVTKYITESRKKTVVSTIGNYISALTTEVNDLNYSFTDSNTVYAVPIECISLERGGSSPLGEWLQMNNEYWAYALVQYDEETSSYRYGYTFKDSNGFGLYPTTENKLNVKGTQIQTNLNLDRPRNGTVEIITEVDNWNGFNVNSNTKLKVLKSTLEGESGDGKHFCTLAQKGENYEEIQEEAKDRVLRKTNTSMNTAFWAYKSQIKNITFADKINIPSSVDEKYIWDVSATGKGKLIAYIIPNKDDSTYFDLYIQADGEIYANPVSNGLFYGFSNVDSINNIEILITSNVTDMNSMFSSTGASSKVFTLDLGYNFDTSRVANMRNMFNNTGSSSEVFTLNLGDKFDTSNVRDMFNMFSNAGRQSKVFKLDLGDKFDTSNVTTMYQMFYWTGANSPKFTLDLGDKFDTSKVVGDMTNMFARAGEKSEVFTLDLGDKFDTSNVTNMNQMFFYTGKSSPVFTLNLGDEFDTSNVTNMSKMFEGTGASSPYFYLDCSKWNVDKVTSYNGFNTHVANKIKLPDWIEQE